MVLQSNYNDTLYSSRGGQPTMCPIGGRSMFIYEDVHPSWSTLTFTASMLSLCIRQKYNQLVRLVSSIRVFYFVVSLSDRSSNRLVAHSFLVFSFSWVLLRLMFQKPWSTRWACFFFFIFFLDGFHVRAFSGFASKANV